MASLFPEKNGWWTIQLKAPDDKRKTIRLGKVPKKTAEAIRVKIEHVVSARITGHALDDETSRWVRNLSEIMADKMIRAGLIPKRAQAALGAFLDRYIKSKASLKPNTLRNYKTTQRLLIDHFGRDKMLADVSEGDADQWREALLGRLAAATVSREVKRARQFFRAAVRQRLIGENPFTDVPAPMQVNPDRQHYVTLEDTHRLLDECRTPLQRLNIALARFAGLRIPSELVGLRWSEVNWEQERFAVHAPKTERHGTGTRIVPIFTQLAPIFREAWEAAPEGEDRIFPDITPKSNRRTWLGKLAARAGVELWEKPWVNMRASAVTDEADETPGHVCETWFGHSEAIADQHYRQTLERHYAKAVQQPNEALQKAVQHPTAKGRTALQAKTQTPIFTGSCESLLPLAGAQVPPRGVEPLSSD